MFGSIPWAANVAPTSTEKLFPRAEKRRMVTAHPTITQVLFGAVQCAGFPYRPYLRSNGEAISHLLSLSDSLLKASEIIFDFVFEIFWKLGLGLTLQPGI